MDKSTITEIFLCVFGAVFEIMDFLSRYWKTVIVMFGEDLIWVLVGRYTEASLWLVVLGIIISSFIIVKWTNNSPSRK
jgi:hypothetical protein